MYEILGFIIFLFCVYNLIKGLYSEYFASQTLVEKIPLQPSPIINEGSDLKTRIISNATDCMIAVDDIMKELNKEKREKRALGFDCEWLSNLRTPYPPLSLLQLCTPRGSCYLFRLNMFQCLPRSLVILLEDDCLKVGVNCAHDAKLIKYNYDVQVENYLDLRHLYDSTHGLGTLAETFLGVTLPKYKSIISSNWNATVLSEDQIRYAALDAWAGIELFKKWLKNKSTHDIAMYIEKYCNTQFTVKKKRENILSYESESFNTPLVNPKFVRKTPLYDNCWMYAPDGKLLCSCNRRKAEWYVHNRLAKVMFEDPFSIELLFKPKYVPDADTDGDFYRQCKKNCCVVCGSPGPCMKHYVTPREYRKHFPISMKSHQSHDIVLTCLNCHVKSKMYMTQLKEKLAKLCDAPTYIAESSHLKQARKMRSICRTLLNSGKNIPENKRQCLEEAVKEFFGLTDVNNKVLQTIMSEETVNEKFVSHGEKVVEYFKKNKSLIELEVLWRQQFLQKLNPQFLPTAWSVNHHHKKSI